MAKPSGGPMILGPSVFINAPVLPTVLLPGACLYGGQVLFSCDDRYLIVHAANGFVQVWDVSAGREAGLYSERHVWRVAWAAHLGGLLAAADDSLLLFQITDSGLREKVLAQGLPAIDWEDSVALGLSSEYVVVCTNRWIRTYDTADFRLSQSQVVRQ